MPRLVSRAVFVLPALLLVCATTPGPAAADDAPQIPVPDLQHMAERQARAVLGRVGLEPGNVFVMSRERVLAYVRKFHPEAMPATRELDIGDVFLQAPPPGSVRPDGATVDLILVGRQDGLLPPGPRFRQLLPGDESPAAAREETPQPGTAERPGADRPASERPLSERVAREAPPARRDPPVHDREQPARMTAPARPSLSERVDREPPAGVASPERDRPAPARAEEAPSQPAPARPALAPDLERPFDGGLPDVSETPPLAMGFADAPRLAPPPDREVVPPLVGLDLSDAELLVRDSEMELYVERRPGHPVGRVLEQLPEAGSRRAPGGIVKVIVTAGGDYEDATPTAAAVFVSEAEVPDLLDRTAAQARRIVESLGLACDVAIAERGLPGRVVDQQPAAGERLAKGAQVLVWVGPDPQGVLEKPYLPDPRRVADVGPSGSRPVATPAPAAPSPVVRAPEPARPVPAVGAPGSTALPERVDGAPRLLSPAPGTPLPAEAIVPIGFMWTRVEGATTYILEIEEAGVGGAWLPSDRKKVRSTAATIELERLDTQTARAIRWRVRALSATGAGTPSPWCELR